MENSETPRNPTTQPSKPRRLPEIPKDQEPYDVKKAPPKPPRQRPRGQRCSTPDPHRRNSQSSNLHKRSRSLTEFKCFTESRRLSLNIGGEENGLVVTQNGNLKHKNCEETTEPKPKQEEQFSLPVYCGEDAIFNRRCATCHRRIFPEGERYLIAQSLLFHVTCFRCSICKTCCDVTNYCYVTEHEKFYCLRHYHEMVAAGNRIGDEQRVVHGIGPGAFVAVVGRRRKRKEITKSLTELQHRRTKLAQIAFQLDDAVEISKNEEEPFLWKHWFDVTYEKITIARAVTELAYQLKEVELCEEQEQLQRKLRRIRKERKGNPEERAKEEGPCLHEILNVIEKRDLLLLELEIERRRDDDEIQKLKLIFQDQSKSAPKMNRNKQGNVQENLSHSSLNGQCVIL